MDQSSTTLLHLLSNPIIADSIIPYLSLSTKLRLSRTSKAYHNWIFKTPNVFRYLDLSNCKGAFTPLIAPIDNGGHSWRAERIDENLTEDEFYSGPLRGVLNRCQRLRILQDVKVVVLDGLGSVTNDIIHEIVTDPRYNVRLLSVRKCPNIGHTRLQQLLQYICRPSRPKDTPRLQGLYVFTDPDHDELTVDQVWDLCTGVTSVDGAALGLLPSSNHMEQFDNAHKWYSPAGKVTSFGAGVRTTWEETLLVCSGIIAFDTVCCKSMHRAAANGLHDASSDFLAASKPGIPTIATVALGQNGCSGCGEPPEGTPVWGKSELIEFPLLAPPPFTGKLMDALRPPKSVRADPSSPPKLIASCTWCLVNRHCGSCQKWWCSECYNPKRTNKLRNLEDLSDASREQPNQIGAIMPDEDLGGDSVKVYNGLCVEHCLVVEMMAGAGSNGMWA